MSGLFSGAPRLGADPILSVMTAFRADPRPEKIDLGVGVYRDEKGMTPVFGAVQDAERRIIETQTTKSYTGLAGDEAFHRALGTLALGDAADWSRLAALATPGGTGAVRQGCELVLACRPEASVWLPGPTWPNHPAILAATGLGTRSFRYYDAAAGTVDAGAMLHDLSEVRPGDVVLLHGACHNPTGADPDLATWNALTDLLQDHGAVPFIDVAYQGFGDDPERDMAGPRAMISRLPEAILAISCSKSFGLYRERVGLLLVQCNPDQRDTVQEALAWQNRLSYAFPPDHGARVVTTILEDDELSAAWRNELAGMRNRLAGLRQSLAAELGQVLQSDRMGWLADGRGMFSLLPLDADQVAALRRDHGVYMIPDGRINIAGARQEDLPKLARALAQAGL